jgi:hypothetical protein
MSSIWETLAEAQPPIDSAVDFPTESRFHIALNVKDVDGVLPFYQAFFAKAPDLARDGYAKFEMRDPPLNISLNRVPHNARGHGRFGIQVRNQALVRALYRRFMAAGLNPVIEGGGPIRHFTVTDPEANIWNVASAE